MCFISHSTVVYCLGWCQKKVRQQTHQSCQMCRVYWSRLMHACKEQPSLSCVVLSIKLFKICCLVSNLVGKCNVEWVDL